MTGRFALAAFAAALLSTSALAQTGDQSGILQYPVSYFADARPNTAYDMIARLPGFSFDDGKSARGFAGTAGNVLIDGQRPTSKTDDLQSVLMRIPAADVERIDVIRGGAQGIDMHGQTVVANVVRKRVDSVRLVADVSNDIFFDGHMTPAASLEFTRHSGDATYEFSLNQLANRTDAGGHGSYSITHLPSGARELYDVRYKGWAFGWSTTGAAAFPLFGGQFKANMAYKDVPYSSSYAYDGPQSWVITSGSGSKDGELGLHWVGPVGDVELETLLLQSLGRNTSAERSTMAGNDQLFSNKQLTSETIGRAIVRYRPSTSLTIEAGAEGAYNWLDGTSAYAVNGSPVALPSANVTVDEKRSEVFAQATWNFAADWKLEAGARFEYSVISETGDVAQSRAFFYPKPRALLTWTPAKDTQIRLRYERVLGQLDFSNFVASSSLNSSGVGAGNPNLSPDRHSQYELAFEQGFWDRGAIVVRLIHDDITGVMDYIPIADPSGMYDAPGNIGSGHKNTVNVELTLPLDRLGLPNGQLKASHIWRATGVRDPLTGEARGISGIRPQGFDYTLTQDIASLSSTWSFYYFNGWDETYARPTQMEYARVPPPYIELSWDYKPTPDWTFSASLRNVGRFRYEDVNWIYGGPRNGTNQIDVYASSIKSQARLYFEIRHTL